MLFSKDNEIRKLEVGVSITTAILYVVSFILMFTYEKFGNYSDIAGTTGVICLVVALMFSIMLGYRLKVNIKDNNKE